MIELIKHLKISLNLEIQNILENYLNLVNALFRFWNNNWVTYLNVKTIKLFKLLAIKALRTNNNKVVRAADNNDRLDKKDKIFIIFNNIKKLSKNSTNFEITYFP